MTVATNSVFKKESIRKIIEETKHSKSFELLKYHIVTLQFTSLMNKALCVFSLSPWHQSSQEVLSYNWGTQTLPWSKWRLYCTRRYSCNATGCDGKQWTERLCKEECFRIQGLLDWCGRHSERRPVCWCQQPASQLLQLGPLQEAAHRNEEGELCCSFSGCTRKVVRWGLSQPQKVHLWICHSLKETEWLLTTWWSFVRVSH